MQKRSIKDLGNGECRNRHKCPEWRKGVPFFGILKGWQKS